MRKQPISSYISLGTVLRYLQDVGEGWPVKGDDPIADNVQGFLKFLDGFSLTVTRRASVTLEKFRAKFDDKDESYRLTAAEAAELKKIIGAIRHTLFGGSGSLGPLHRCREQDEQGAERP